MNDFATIKVRQRLRKWLKQEAARQDVPMYVLLEQLVIEARGGKSPWHIAEQRVQPERS